jgi:hypothetical protein
MRPLRWMVIVVGVIAAGAWAARAARGPVTVLVEHGAPAWSRHLTAVDAAVGRRDASQALYEWRHAYLATLHSGRWAPLVAAGDAALRIDALSGIPGSTARSEARQAYVDAVLRAHAQRDAAGILRAAGALERLGDAEVAASARRMAGSLDARPARAAARDRPASEPGF